MGFASSLNTYAVFLYISKAYDSVWLTGLLYKLVNIGVSGACLNWLKSFITGRAFCIRVGNHLSDTRTLFTGVPQGSILSPLLLNIMLADFPDLSSKVRPLLYADDITLFCNAKNVVGMNVVAV